LWVDAVFFGDNFPELAAYLIAALACLDVDNFAHFGNLSLFLSD